MLNRKRKLKIAMVAPLAEAVPPEKYGGIELVVYYLVEGLVKKGHKVTLFANKKSKSSAYLDPAFVRPIKGDSMSSENINYCQKRIEYVYQKADQFDLIHNHDGFLSFLYSRSTKTPTITTWHAPLEITNKKKRKIILEYKNVYIISISNSQRKPLPNLNYLATIYNGIDIKQFRFKEKPKNNFIFLGRFTPDKRADWAIYIAKKAGVKLELAGKIRNDKKMPYIFDLDYWQKKILPAIDNQQIKYVGEVEPKTKGRFLQAKGLLFPINWDEPFGLVMVEAMACGTPVIAFNRGSVPEVVTDKKTGFIISPGDLDEMIKTINKIDQINRKDCRKHVEEKFTIEKMVDEYEKAYYKVLS